MPNEARRNGDAGVRNQAELLIDKLKIRFPDLKVEWFLVTFIAW